MRRHPPSRDGAPDGRFDAGPNNLDPKIKKPLEDGGRHPYIAFTQFARACGRVPVGGHPDKRPDSRQGLEDGWRGWTSLKSRLPVSARTPFPDTDRQPEAKPANPESPRGTQLKATTERAFLVSPAFHRPAPKRLVLHCRACGVSPSDGYQSPDVFVRRISASPSRPESLTAQPASCRIGAACAVGEASHDRAHP